MSEEELIKQIKTKLSKFTIDPEFYKLAIEALAQEEDDFVLKDQAAMRATDAAIKRQQSAISNLRRMRYSGEADDDGDGDARRRHPATEPVPARRARLGGDRPCPPTPSASPPKGRETPWA